MHFCYSARCKLHLTICLSPIMQRARCQQSIATNQNLFSLRWLELNWNRIGWCGILHYAHPRMSYFISFALLYILFHFLVIRLSVLWASVDLICSLQMLVSSLFFLWKFLDYLTVNQFMRHCRKCVHMLAHLSSRRGIAEYYIGFKGKLKH